MRSSFLLLIACLLLALGCGDDSDDEAGGGSSSGGGTGYGAKKESGGGSASKQLKLTADPGGALKFDKTTLSTKPGKVTVVLDNPSSVPHAIEVEVKDWRRKERR